MFKNSFDQPKETLTCALRLGHMLEGPSIYITMIEVVCIYAYVKDSLWWLGFRSEDEG